jgi:hypothetical protein
VAAKDAFWMTATRDGICHECEWDIRKGDRMVYDPDEFHAFCTPCGEDLIGKEED